MPGVSVGIRHSKRRHPRTEHFDLCSVSSNLRCTVRSVHFRLRSAKFLFICSMYVHTRRPDRPSAPPSRHMLARSRGRAGSRPMTASRSCSSNVAGQLRTNGGWDQKSGTPPKRVDANWPGRALHPSRVRTLFGQCATARLRTRHGIGAIPGPFGSMCSAKGE